MRKFYVSLKKYLLSTSDKNFFITTLHPDPVVYFAANFGFFGTIEFSCSDTEDDYISALHDYPAKNSADALAHNSNLLILSSPTCEWAIYADRDADIAICAFSKLEQMQSFKSICASHLLNGVEVAADYAFGTTDETSVKSKFITNYYV